MDENERLTRYFATVNKIKYINLRGYKVEEIWSCEYYEWVKAYKTLQKKKSILPEFAKTHPGPMDHQHILEAVINEKLFGMVEVDIMVSYISIIKQFPLSHFLKRLIFCNQNHELFSRSPTHGKVIINHQDHLTFILVRCVPLWLHHILTMMTLVPLCKNTLRKKIYQRYVYNIKTIFQLNTE